MYSIENTKLNVPPLPQYYVERERLKNIFKAAGKKNIYICAGPGCGKTTALSALAEEEERVVWLSVSGFDTAQRLRMFLSSHFDTDINENLTLSDVVCRNVAGCTLILDDIDNFFDRDVLEAIVNSGNIRVVVSSRKYLKDIKELFDETGGVFISDEDMRLTDSEVKEICGCNNNALAEAIGGYAAAAALTALYGMAEFKGKPKMLISKYIYEQVFMSMGKDKRRLISDTVLTDRVPVGLCEYLYGSEYGRKVAYGLKHSFFVRLEDDCLTVHPLLKNAVMDNCGRPRNSVNEKILSYYEETDNHKSYIDYCIMLDKLTEAADCLDKFGFEFLDKGEFEFLDKALAFTENITGRRFGIVAVKGAVNVLRGNYSSGYNLCRIALEHFMGLKSDIRFVYCAAFTARTLRNTSHLKEALNVINEADKVRKNFPLICGYLTDAEKIAVYNDMGNFAEGYNTCMKGIELCSVKGDIRIKKLYERLSCCVYYFSKRLARAVYAYDKYKELENEDYWIKKRHEVYMYGLGALHIIGDRKRAAAEFADMKRTLIESGITGEMWYGELHYLKIAMYAEVFNERTYGESFTDCMCFMEATRRSIKNHTLYLEYLDIINELYNAINKGDVNEETFYCLPEKIDRLNFSAAIECICAYIKVLIDRNDVDHIIPIVDRIISENGGMLNVFFVNVVMDIALNRFNSGNNDRAEEYIQWLCDCASDVGDPGGIDTDKLKVLALLSGRDDLTDTLNAVNIKCCLESKKAYAEIFGEFRVTKADYKNVKWRTAKTKDIMAYFIYMDGEGVSKNRIIQNVWGEEPSKALTPIFNTSMYNLRKSLSREENAEVLFNDGMYYIDKDAVGSDYALFKAAVSDFYAEKTYYNALRVLSRFSPVIMGGADGVFISPLRRECFGPAKDAVSFLCRQGHKEIVMHITDKWETDASSELFVNECRKMTEN